MKKYDSCALEDVYKIMTSDESIGYMYANEREIAIDCMWMFQDEPNPIKVVREWNTYFEANGRLFLEKKIGHIAIVWLVKRKTVNSE